MDLLSAGDRHDGGELVEPDHHGAARQPAGAAAAGHRLAALAAFQRARRRQVRNLASKTLELAPRSPRKLYTFDQPIFGSVFELL